MQRNRLAEETSPYLLQHADNPVNWYAWGEEALAAARREHKPILLSVGYSSCHWCHVMAHESFEDPDTAAVMNRLFVNVKVDREERPDLDKIYQVAQQLLTRHPGGWPLTMFLTPEDQQPFFGGTYFPKRAGRGLPAFVDLLQRVAYYFHGHAEAIRSQHGELVQAFERLSLGSNAAAAGGRPVLNAEPLNQARRALERSFDAQSGGFGRAPKFPQATCIERALRHWSRSARDIDPDLKALYIATLSLTRMAEGGIYDQLGGGFARYATDDAWMIPHFEKMLYDNGQLLGLYAQAALATGEVLFARIARETAEWLLREMRSPEGGFYSSLDADSEGHEGTFYVWNRDEVRRHVPAAAYDAFARRFGLDREPNFEGRWHLYAAVSPETAGTTAEELDVSRTSLLAARDERIRPERDEKILTAWNALAIKGLAIAGRVLGRPDFTAAAGAAVDFIRLNLWRDGRLLVTSRNGRARLAAYVDDYAFLADALLELLQTRWRSSDLAFATELADVLLKAFEDPVHGGFFFTAADHEKLLHRTKTFSDDSLPSGNGIAAAMLCRLGCLLGELRYLDAAERTLQAALPLLGEFPASHMSMANALEDFLTSTHIVILRGAPVDIESWARAVGAEYAPTRMVFAIPADAPDLPAALRDKRPGGGATAYVCAGMTCSPPITALPTLLRELAAHPKTGSSPNRLD